MIFSFQRNGRQYYYGRGEKMPYFLVYSAANFELRTSQKGLA